MGLVSGGRSTLNPNAPLFIPAAYRQVEDFSPEWWELVKTSTWFRDYWLAQHQEEETFISTPNDDDDGVDIADLLPESFDFDVDEELYNVDAQFEEFVQSYPQQNGSALFASKPVNGMHLCSPSMTIFSF
uniref:Protein EARLY RESPONSIVE TO DEHYDRATION 15-like n=1 Tax=Nelumbo nucifera TaxID=4432 RepID=A0A822ZCC4_NELNU|nr:TPA_asm: hypothetical protein HUJ06_000787 [Nelumbo nucifera]